jgi:hypothetical protein
MPVTARLLQRLHESLGDEATNDLFAWWEEAATVNRGAVREVADLYYARFEARLEKGLAEQRLEMNHGLAQVRSELAELRSDMEKGFVEVRSEMGKESAQLRSEMAGHRADVIKWMFMFWIGTIVPLAGLMLALTRL